MNPNLDRLHPYPFQKLSTLFSGIVPDPQYSPISLSIGEPKHPTPEFIKSAITANLGGLALHIAIGAGTYVAALVVFYARSLFHLWIVRAHQPLRS